MLFPLSFICSEHLVLIVLLYSHICFYILYEVDFLQGILKNVDINLTHTFNSSVRHIDDVLSLTNS